MVTCKCIMKERDRNNNITGYVLEDAYGNKCHFTARDLKYYIKEGNIQVLNLKLTSDDRLIDEKIKSVPEIPVVDSIESNNITTNSWDFMSGKSGEKRIEPLYGWMSEENTVYTESIQGLTGGIVRVSRMSWEIQLLPERVNRIGVWVNHGFIISGGSVDKFKDSLRKNYTKCIEKMNRNINDTWEHEDGFDVLYSCRQSLMNGPYLDVWPKHSQIHLKSQQDIEWLIRKLEETQVRVQEIREVKGWRTKKVPVMKPDGTVETRGNWFNKIFGNK